MKKKKYLLIVLIAAFAIGSFYLFKQNMSTEKTSVNMEEITLTTVLLPEDATEGDDADNKSAKINKSKAEQIAQEELNDYEVINSEQRSSTGEDYFLVTMQNGENIVHIYVDSETGEILYQD